eukprot:CAMPEP_0177278074 /NCGR_PEP_ID=MMETSP0367-20130122/69123_1 /TAXON_ID=447022 ORGANISM="Scrippsiella hangoei-like, Strain SHHI-4" /NCGR_SAMPLE_ID=MMETSP0367 /ASSEMBLY_ACC=CAM_ASM_000362 /LENGTH=86 /DNA_ID=CAMNT_0018734685 /DNA_START=1 /DNA_END=258 /DNA_ORIENTATION=+
MSTPPGQMEQLAPGQQGMPQAMQGMSMPGMAMPGTAMPGMPSMQGYNPAMMQQFAGQMAMMQQQQPGQGAGATAPDASQQMQQQQM